jgi:hypothetical protein
MANYPFTAQEIESISDLPPGPYICEITKTDVLKTKQGDGRYVLVVFIIIDGEYKGRKIFQNFNTLNKNPLAVEIGKKHLSLLCNSVGIESFNDTDELLHKQTVIRLGFNNKLFGFKKVGEDVPVSVKNTPEGKEDFDDNIPF